jgi:hypothetical protein
MSDEADEADATVSPAPAKLDDVDWKPHREAIRRRFQRAPWLPADAWEFTPHDGITHTFGCDICGKYKEHQIIAEAMGDTSDSSAWKIRGTYEQDLIQLGWDLAHEHGRPQQDRSALEIMEQRLHEARTDAEFRRCLSDQATKQCSELRRLNDQASETYNKLLAELEYANVDSALRDDEAKLWEDHYKALHAKHAEVEKQLAISQRIIALSTENARMGDQTPATGTTDRAEQNESSLNSVVGIHFRNLPSMPKRLKRDSDSDHVVQISADTIARIAAARDGNNTLGDREFRASQNYKNETGERPQSVSKDRRCMAALVRVNNIEAYALLDSGSTMVSITQDFTRVAKLRVQELANPVPLQLGTVGSRSMINFGAKAHLQVGPINDNDVYLDVVNIDRYDMIIGTPFMRKHGLVLDFGMNTLSTWGTIIPTLTEGQEDLVLVKR